MSKRVSGQLRVLDKSSSHNSQFGQDNKTPVPDLKLQKTLNEKKEHSMRGKKIKQLKKDTSVKLRNASTFTEPMSFQSVGFMRVDNFNIEKIVNTKPEPKDKMRGKKKVAKPARRGPKDSKGAHIPNNKGNKPPTKKSSTSKKDKKTKLVPRTANPVKGKTPGQQQEGL